MTDDHAAPQDSVPTHSEKDQGSTEPQEGRSDPAGAAPEQPASDGQDGLVERLNLAANPDCWKAADCLTALQAEVTALTTAGRGAYQLSELLRVENEELKRQLAEAKADKHILDTAAAKAEAERDALREDAERYRQELQNIINIDMQKMRDEWGRTGAAEQFRLWAQNRARAAIDAARRK